MTTKPLRIDGIDLSHYQPQKINYAAAKAAGVKFLYHKATEGTGWADPNYSLRRIEAKNSALLFGAYHFAQPTKNNAVAEADWFLKNAKPQPGDMLPALDLEVNPNNLSVSELSTWVNTWWSHVQHVLGIQRGVTYTHFTLTSTANTYLWVPRYTDSNATPVVPAPWGNFAIRQFSDGRYGVPNSVPGVGHCDINHIRDGFLGLARIGWERRLTIPQPKPVKARTYRVSTFNVEYGHKPVDAWAKMILDHFETNKIEVMAIDESEDYFQALKKIAEAKGHRLLGNSPTSRIAILVRRGLTVTSTTTVPGNVTTWKMPNGGTGSMAHPVVAKINGVNYVAIHAPVQAWVPNGHGGHHLAGPPERVQAYKDFTANLVRFVNALSGPVVVLGDWNCPPGPLGAYSPDSVRAQIGAIFARPFKNTGHGEIDFGIVRGAHVSGVTVVPQPAVGDHSDHMQVYFDLKI